MIHCTNRNAELGQVLNIVSVNLLGPTQDLARIVDRERVLGVEGWRDVESERAG
jgi:hypothetical protein